MKKRTLFILIPLLSLLAASCGPAPLSAAGPEPVPAAAQLQGTLIASETKKPVEASIDLLAITPDGQGFSFVKPDYDQRSIHKNKTTANGSFVFENIQPGDYVLMATIECSPQQVTDKDRGNILQINVAAGQVVDLGALPVDLSLIEKGNPCD